MTSTRRPDYQDPYDALPGDEVPVVQPFLQVGSTGLKRSAGLVNEEFLPQLSGRRGMKIYREMLDNPPVIGGWFMAVTFLIRQIEWRVESASNSAADRANGDFLESAMNDMEYAWGDVVMDLCSFIGYGWEVAEILYKRRVGMWQDDPLKRSKYTDGRTGWRNIMGISQDSLWRWIFGPNGEILGLVQSAAPDYTQRAINIKKCVHVRTTKSKNNPEGRSCLRNAYEPFYYLKRFREYEAVGVSRDLAGIPIAKVPNKILSAQPGTQDGKMLAAITQLVKGVSRNEQEGIVWPYDVDPDTKLPEYEFGLVTSGGTRQFDTRSIISDYKTEILQAVVADWLQVGHENNGGAYNMHTDKTGLFRTIVNTFARMIADEVNNQAVPRLFELNGVQPKELPKIVPNNVDPPDLAQLGAFLQTTGGLGLQWFPDPELQKFLRDAAGLPPLDEQLEHGLEIEQRQSAILRLAQQKMEAVQMDMQLEQGQMALQQGQLGMAQQQQQLEAGPQDQTDPGDPQGKHAQAQAGEQTNQAKIGTKVQETKLAQEKAKLANLKKPAVKPAARPVRKVYLPPRRSP